MSDKTKVGRVALRQEGEMWNAYYAMPDTMESAILLASIKMVFVIDPKRKLAFMQLARECVGDILQQQIGVRPSWKKPVTAPESERGGNA